MSLPVNTVVCGDAFTVLEGWPVESIDMVMFSPPYWGLRDYGVEGQMGLEAHPNLWIERMVLLCRLLRRVLKKSGSLYLNVGDTYFSTAGNNSTFSKDTTLKGSRERRHYEREKDGSNWLQPKQLLLMPSRLAIALQDDGWTLRNDICWHKPNHMPSSVKDRLTNSWEHIFHFVKARRYFYDLDAIRKPHSIKNGKRVGGGIPHHFGRKVIAQSKDVPLTKIANPLGKNPSDTITTRKVDAKYFGQDVNPSEGHIRRGKELHDGFPKGYMGHSLGKNPSDFWSINTKPFKGAHFAVYPEKICRMPIKSSCPKDGIVLDPMCGSGTTLVVAHKLGRRWIGIELNKDYVELAEKRLESVGGFSARLEQFTEAEQ